MSLKGGDIVTRRGDYYDVLLKGGETFYHVSLYAGETIMCCFNEEDSCHVLFHGGETIVMCCYSEGRQ